MKPLVTNYHVFTWLCVCPIEKPISWLRKFANISLISIIFIAIATLVTTSGMCFIKTVSLDLEDAIYSLSHVFGFSFSIYLMIAIFILRHKITGLFSYLTRIYEKS